MKLNARLPRCKVAFQMSRLCFCKRRMERKENEIEIASSVRMVTVATVLGHAFHLICWGHETTRIQVRGYRGREFACMLNGGNCGHAPQHVRC